MSDTEPGKNDDLPEALVLPPRPIEPDPQECCRRGCCPCIFDYYHDALERWEARVAELTRCAADALHE